MHFVRPIKIKCTFLILVLFSDATHEFGFWFPRILDIFKFYSKRQHDSLYGRTMSVHRILTTCIKYYKR
jgi:hypothetical protein